MDVPLESMLGLHDVKEDFDVDWDHVLGSGMSGKVRLAICKRSKKKYALKFLKDSDNSRREIVHALRISRVCEHVVKPHYVYLNCKDPASGAKLEGGSRRQFVLLMEYFAPPVGIARSDLFSLLRSKKLPLAENLCKQMLLPVILALECMHARSLVHGDIKLENMLFDTQSSSCKLSDFGFTNVVGVRSPPKYTTAYMAPETIESLRNVRAGQDPLKLDCASDMWSLGVVLFVMLVGRFPFGRGPLNDAFEELVLNGDVHLPCHLSHHARDVLRALLVRKVEERMTSSSLLLHPWLVSSLPALEF